MAFVPRLTTCDVDAPVLPRQETAITSGTTILLYWQSLGGPELQREFRFHMERKWRADFAHVESRTLIEVEGGIYVQGRHNRPQGFAADAEKYLEAALDGWRVLRLTEFQITVPMTERIIRFLLDVGTTKSNGPRGT